MKRVGFLLVFVLGWASTALAKVEHSAAEGFHIRLEVTVKASPAEVYQQFLRVGEWWSADHTWFGKAEGLSIEPRAGGCFCEKEGDKSALHMLVSYVDPGKEVRMIGGLGPLSGLGLHGAMSWTFEAGAEPGTTRITHVYRVTGYYPDGLGGLAVVVDGVQAIQIGGLAARFGP